MKLQCHVYDHHHVWLIKMDALFKLTTEKYSLTKTAATKSQTSIVVSIPLVCTTTVIVTMENTPLLGTTNQHQELFSLWNFRTYICDGILEQRLEENSDNPSQVFKAVLAACQGFHQGLWIKGERRTYITLSHCFDGTLVVFVCLSVYLPIYPDL